MAIGMGKFMRAGKTVLLVMCMCMLGLTACGERTDGDADGAATSISVKKDGSISSKIVEDFGESYYDAGALKSMIETSISDYRTTNVTARITLRNYEVADGTANVLMEFGDYQSYAGFNDERFFAGTVQGANQAGFDLDMTLSAVSDKLENASVSKSELLGMGSSHIVILETEKPDDDQEAETIRVNCFDEILYVSDGVTAVGKRSADVKLPGGYGVIVFK